MRTIETGDRCENGSCTHQAHGIWTGNGGWLAATRDYMQFKWCRCCMLSAQIAFAEEAVTKLVALKGELTATTCVVQQ